MSTGTKEKELQESLEKREYWWWAEKARSPRIDYLRKAVWSKGTKGSTYLPGTKVCTHGVKTFTEVFKRPEAGSEPYIITWAKAQAETLDTIPIFIVDQSRLVGYVGSAPHKIYWTVVPSYSINEDLFNDRTGLLDEEERPMIRECLDFMKPRTLQSKTERYLSRRQRLLTATSQTFTGAAYADGHSYPTPQWDYYKKGFNAIIAEIENNLAETMKDLHEMGSLPDPDKEGPAMKKMDNWMAMKIMAEAIIRWARRYSRLAKIIAENFEADPKRKQELLEIAERCERVPAEPPRSFVEALQFEQFKTFAQKYEWGDGAWPARPDYWFGPYYKKDVVEDKTLTREDALEYMCEYLIRCFEYGKAWNRQYRELMQGDPGPYVWVIGGVTENGADACNEVTDLMLEAARLVRVVSPTLAFRYHRNVPISTLKNVFECIRHGLGYPNIRHDDVLIAANMYWSGTPLEEARTWVAQACIVPCPTTKRGVMPVRYSASSTLGSKALELALWNGYNPVMKMQIGPKTGDPTKMTFDELFDATIEQFKVMHWEAAKIRNITRFVEMTMGRPFLSATWEECVEQGLNAFERKEYGNGWLTTFIWADQLDALAALKKLVFEEKKYTMEQVLKMLAANWEGYETERMDFVRAPKWGNDDDYVDSLFVRAHLAVRDKVCRPAKQWGTSSRGIPTAPQNIAAYSVAGVLLGALPNGRRLGDTCYDGGCSPGAGLDRKGPTAVLRSVAKLDHRTMFRADLLNQRLSPAQLVGDKGFELWHNYIKTWYDLGINHVQFNMVDNETLLAAQKEPEKYSELIVRIAGYSAHFVDMNKKTQDTIIARNVQTL